MANRDATLRPVDFELRFTTQQKRRNNIPMSRCDSIPIHMQGHPATFVDVLAVMSLVAISTEEEITVGQLTLDVLPVVRADASCQDIFSVLRDRKVWMVLVTGKGTPQGEPLGIVTARHLVGILIRARPEDTPPFVDG